MITYIHRGENPFAGIKKRFTEANVRHLSKPYRCLPGGVKLAISEFGFNKRADLFVVEDSTIHNQTITTSFDVALIAEKVICEAELGTLRRFSNPASDLFENQQNKSEIGHYESQIAAINRYFGIPE